MSKQSALPRTRLYTMVYKFIQMSAFATQSFCICDLNNSHLRPKHLERATHNETVTINLHMNQSLLQCVHRFEFII